MKKENASSPAPDAIPLVSSVAPLAAATDAWLVDIWGVMHNGVRPFHDAARACATFRRIGGTVILLSNAPRPASSVVEQLDRIGGQTRAFDRSAQAGHNGRV